MKDVGKPCPVSFSLCFLGRITGQEQPQARGESGESCSRAAPRRCRCRCLCLCLCRCSAEERRTSASKFGYTTVWSSLPCRGRLSSSLARSLQSFPSLAFVHCTYELLYLQVPTPWTTVIGIGVQWFADPCFLSAPSLFVVHETSVSGFEPQPTSSEAHVLSPQPSTRPFRGPDAPLENEHASADADCSPDDQPCWR